MAIILMLAVGASALGCGEKKTGEESRSTPSGPYMTKFRIGRAVASDRRVTVETDSFRQGDPIYISFEVKNVPPKSQARVVWSDSFKKKISEEQKPLASGAGAVSFEMKDAANVAPGDYLVEFFYGDREGAPEKWWWLGSKGFQVGQKRP